MPKLSEQLADLSAHAKHAEDAVSAAQKEAHDMPTALSGKPVSRWTMLSRRSIRRSRLFSML